MRRLGAETVVVDSADHAAHALSPFASAILRLCDGRTSPASAAGLTGCTVAEVQEAVVTLASLGLVESAGMTRRVALQRAGVLGAGVLVTSVAAPLAAAHATTAHTFGNTPAAQLGGVADGYHNTTTWITNKALGSTIPAGATVTQFNGYAIAGGGSVTFVLIDAATAKEVFVSQTATPSAGSVFTVLVPTASRVKLTGAAYLGVYQAGVGVISYTTTAATDQVSQTGDSNGPLPVVGNAPTTGNGGNAGLVRTYAIQASYNTTP